jgi:hypothetical protein
MLSSRQGGCESRHDKRAQEGSTSAGDLGLRLSTHQFSTRIKVRVAVLGKEILGAFAAPLRRP